jgi:Spy/CpxP family protein refolding chaperone
MRNLSKWLAIGALLATGSGTMLVADDAPATRPAHAGRLIKPWSEMSDLTDDQKAQIEDINAKADAEIRAIHEKQHADILALLNDDQKKELTDVEAKDRLEAAEKAAKRHHVEPTTNPAS